MYNFVIKGTPSEVMEQVDEMVRVDEEITLDKRMSEADEMERDEMIRDNIYD